jgi:hypothetical protein
LGAKKSAPHFLGEKSEKDEFRAWKEKMFNKQEV